MTTVSPADPAASSSTTTAVEAERLARKRELALGYRIFAALRWGDLGDGHITARDPEFPDCFWVLKYPVSFQRATSADMVLIDASGRAVGDDPGPINDTAYRIHWPIHDARPDIVAAAHTHTHWGTPFAAERRLLQPITQEACFFVDDHSLFDDEEVQVMTTDCGERIAQALGTNRAVILANHGLLTTGPSVGEAIAAFVLMERVAEAHLKAPDAVPISEAAAQAAKAGLQPEQSLSEAFDFLVSRYVSEGDGRDIG